MSSDQEQRLARARAAFANAPNFPSFSNRKSPPPPSMLPPTESGSRSMTDDDPRRWDVTRSRQQPPPRSSPPPSTSSSQTPPLVGNTVLASASHPEDIYSMAARAVSQTDDPTGGGTIPRDDESDVSSDDGLLQGAESFHDDIILSDYDSEDEEEDDDDDDDEEEDTMLRMDKTQSDSQDEALLHNDSNQDKQLDVEFPSHHRAKKTLGFGKGRTLGGTSLDTPTSGSQEGGFFQSYDDDDDDDEQGMNRQGRTDASSTSTRDSSLSGLSRRDPAAHSNPPTMVVSPTSFTMKNFDFAEWSTQPNSALSTYLDPFEAGITKTDAALFQLEHRIFTRALLQLLAEREAFDASDNPPIKAGTLKKSFKTFGSGWKTKYVEIRRGMFTYKDDQHSYTGKNIPLQFCSCRPVEGSTAFELAVDGAPRRLWMAQSAEDRKEWLEAIQQAMAPEKEENNGKGTIVPQLESTEADHAQFVRIMNEVKRARTRPAYLDALSKMWGVSLHVELYWIRQQAAGNATTGGGSSGALSPMKPDTRDLSSKGGSRLYKDLRKDSFCINGYLIRGNAGHGPEVIVGALSRCILEFDKSAVAKRNLHGTDHSFPAMSELQAVSYARQVLLAASGPRGKNETYFAVNALCNNANLVILVPMESSSEQLRINVSHVESGQSSSSSDAALVENESRDKDSRHGADKTGWLQCKSRAHQKTWRKRFSIISHGVISFYEQEFPRPHGSRGQIPLAGATLSVSEKGGISFDVNASSGDMLSTQYILSLLSKDESKDRQFLFEDEREMRSWRAALKKAIATAGDAIMEDGPASPDRRGPTAGKLTDMFRGFNPLKKNSEHHSQSSSHDSRSKKQEAGTVIDRDATVQIIVESSSIYKIITADPTGNETKDTWLMLRTKYMQSYVMSGGPEGCLRSGDETVEMNFLKGLVPEKLFEEVFSPKEDPNSN